MYDAYYIVCCATVAHVAAHDYNIRPTRMFLLFGCCTALSWPRATVLCFWANGVRTKLHCFECPRTHTLIFFFWCLHVSCFRQLQRLLPQNSAAQLCVHNIFELYLFNFHFVLTVFYIRFRTYLTTYRCSFPRRLLRDKTEVCGTVVRFINYSAAVS